MHEMSLCEGILQVIEAESGKQGFSRVKNLWLEIGELAGVEIEALEFCFDAVKRDSLAADANMNVIPVPGRAWCLQCSHDVPLRQRFDACPDCGSYQLQVTAGDEMRIKELEVE